MPNPVMEAIPLHRELPDTRLGRFNEGAVAAEAGEVTIYPGVSWLVYGRRVQLKGL